eukprot:scaffold101820_cov27-Phaeocystis_antarctica.AAC.1
MAARGETPFFGDFPATGRTLARKRWPWPKRPPKRACQQGASLSAMGYASAAAAARVRHDF